jgi:hypothetical protein
VSPWDRAETEAPSPTEDDEAPLRALFARRAQALETTLGAVEVPSLEAVLAASRREAPRAAEKKALEKAPRATDRSARGRVIAALSLAAACMLAALSELPRDPAPSRIVADPATALAAAPVPDALPKPPGPSLAVVEPEPAGECTMNESVAVPEDHACVSSCPLDTTPPVSSPVVEDPESNTEVGCSMSP